MLSLMPQSTATTLKRWLEVRAYQRFLQLTWATWSRRSSSAFSRATAWAVGTPVSVSRALRLPWSRMERVSFRVSTPSMAGMP